MNNLKMMYVLINDSYVRFAAIGAAMLWCVVVLLYLCLIVPLYEERKKQNFKLSNIKSEYAFRESVSNQIKDLDKYLKIIKSIEKKLSSELKGSEVLIQITDLFSKFNMDVLSENYSKIKSENGYRYIDADFKVKANYRDVRLVLDEFSNLPFMVHVTKVTVIKDHEYVVAEIQTRITSFGNNSDE